MISIRRTWPTFVFVIVILQNRHGYSFDYAETCLPGVRPCQPESKLDCVTTQSQPGNQWSKCLCKVGLIPFPEVAPADCVPKSTKPVHLSGYKGNCSDNQGCARGFVCIANTSCDCSEGFAWSSSSKFCKPVLAEVPCNPESTPNECDQLGIVNYACNETAKVCRCPEKTEYAPEFKACKLKAGEDCYFVLDNNQQVTAHDLCASQHCGTDEISAKCDCREEVNGGRMIWSQQDNRCIRNFFGIYCNENSNCTESNLNSQGRVGLICNTTVKPARCDCPDARSFSRGYCVTATALYNESCDPTELSTTCKTEGGTLLTCREEQEGENKWKCACLIKDVSARARRKGASTILYWDSKNQICDLAPNDERCTANYQCKTGRCSKNRCRSKSDGSRVSLQNFLVITITFVSIILKVVA